MYTCILIANRYIHLSHMYMHENLGYVRTVPLILACIGRNSIRLGDAKMLTPHSNLHFGISNTMPIFHKFLFKSSILWRYPLQICASPFNLKWVCLLGIRGWPGHFPVQPMELLWQFLLDLFQRLLSYNFGNGLEETSRSRRFGFSKRLVGIWLDRI